MKDPVWVSFTLLTLAPVFAIRTLFFALLLSFICFGTPAVQRGADEYQLLQYILAFKGMQFLTGGVLMSLLGAAQYYYFILQDFVQRYL